MQTKPLAAGDPAPQISARDHEGNILNFESLYAAGATLIYFYPKANTPGCTAQACSLRDGFMELRARGLQIIGVSQDAIASQEKFHEKYHLPFTLVSDPGGKVAAAFGVPTFLGLTRRQSFLVENGKIVWLSRKAKTRDHAAEVQAAMDVLKPEF